MFLVSTTSRCFLYVFQFQFVNDLHALISPSAPGTPLPLILLGKVLAIAVGHCLVYMCLYVSKALILFFLCQSKNALLASFLFLDHVVWLGRTGIYKVMH